MSALPAPYPPHQGGPRKLLGDKAYDSAELRQWLKGRGIKAVVPNRSNRKQPFSFDKKS